MAASFRVCIDPSVGRAMLAGQEPDGSQSCWSDPWGWPSRSSCCGPTTHDAHTLMNSKIQWADLGKTRERPPRRGCPAPPGPRREGRERRVGRIVRVTFLLVVAACSSDDVDVGAPATTTTGRDSVTLLAPTPTPTSGPAGRERTVEDEIIDRYQGFWAARFEANQPPVNPDHPGLWEYATGTQLENVTAETRRNLANGTAFDRPKESVARRQVRVVSINGDEATLQDCAVNDGIVYRPSTGEVLDDAVVTHSVEATMQQVGGVWKLEAARLLQSWEGVAGCALSDDF